MALYDHRVFRTGDEWWVAQVHSGGGVGVGDIPPRITTERVIFTNLSDEDQESSTASIPAGFLNRMNHRSIVRLLRQAEPLRSRFDMYPYNTPNEDDFLGSAILLDDEGLRWAVKTIEVQPNSAGAYRPDALVEVVCLDDSAMRRELLIEMKSLPEVLSGGDRAHQSKELVQVVKATYHDLNPENRGA